MGRQIKLFTILFLCIGAMIAVSQWKQKHQMNEREEKNGYITNVSGTSISYLLSGKEKKYQMNREMPDQNLVGMADLVLHNEKVVTVKKKPDFIAGKLLSIDKNSVNIQNYGRIDVADNPSLYYQGEKEITQGNWQELTVGQEPLRWIVAEGKICGVILASHRVGQIRVLLKMNREEEKRDRVLIHSDATFYAMSGGQTIAYKKGTRVVLTPETVKEPVSFYAQGKNEIKIDDYDFGYAGTIEVSKRDNALIVINELPIQDYLCGVVPGEMSPDSPVEALRAQAICARSYLMQQMKNGRLAEYGAHVDDTVSFQVYGTQPKEERSNQAVYDTKDQILVCGDEPVSAYFYSSGSGLQASAKEVWNTKKEVSYLGRFVQNPAKEEKDLSNGEELKKFLNEDADTIEKESPWYRWSARIRKKDLLAKINERLLKRYMAEPSNIRIRAADGTMKKQKPQEISQIKHISISERGESGVATCMEIVSDKETICIYSQYSIRMILGDKELQYTRKDGSSAKGLTLLPSGFFVMEETNDSYELTGGGYGHGVGMSQNGACVLAKQGKKASEILAYYFSGASIIQKDSFE